MGTFTKTVSAASDVASVAIRCNIGCTAACAPNCVGSYRGEKVTLSRSLMISLQNNIRVQSGRQTSTSTVR